jgi:ParB family chromosome partitioning protein
VGDGLLSAGHAKALLGHPDRSYQESLAKRAVRDELTVRAVEDLVKERLRLESQADRDAEGPTEDSDGGDDSGERRLRQPGLVELEELLANYLETRVSISMASKRGKVTIEFADLEDLERMYRRIIEGG